MSRDPKLDLLRSVPGLANCTDGELEPLLSIVDETTIPAGRVLTTEGVGGHDAFVIVDGAADVSLRGEHLATLGPGQFVGEMALLEERPRSTTVTASSEMRLLVLDQSGFAALLDDARVARAAATALSSRLRDIENREGVSKP